ncbi:MAG TPA: hemolysin family protein [bacterium]|nr:hemolysin family protein [bacterium]
MSKLFGYPFPMKFGLGFNTGFNTMTFFIFFQLAVVVICLAFSAFFSCSETAMFSIGKIRLKTLKNESAKGFLVNEALKNPQRLIIAILFGNIAVNVLSTTIGENLIYEFLGSIENESLFFLKKYRSAFNIAVMTVLILICGEITPKTIALSNPANISLKVGGFINKLIYLTTPAYKVIGKISGYIITRITTVFRTDSMKLSEEELKLAVELGLTDGMVSPEEEDMLKSVFDFSKTMVKELMTPKPDIIACSINSSLQDLFNLFNESGISRIPVYDKNLNNIKGVIYKKDLFLNYQKINDNFWINHIRPAYFVPETKNAAALLKSFKLKKQHIAVVVDEYGGVSGLVTLKDLVEEIFGEILDRKQTEDSYIKRIGLYKYRVNGRMPLDYFNEVFNADIKDDFLTINGYIIKALGMIPEPGDELVINENLKISVENILNNEIKTVKVERLKTSGNDSSDKLDKIDKTKQI